MNLGTLTILQIVEAKVEIDSKLSAVEKLKIEDLHIHLIFLIENSNIKILS